MHPARCLGGPGVEQQYAQLTRTPKVSRSTAPPRERSGAGSPEGGNVERPLVGLGGGTRGRAFVTVSSPTVRKPVTSRTRTAPPPLEAATPDCRGEAIYTTPLRGAESRVSVTV